MTDRPFQGTFYSYYILGVLMLGNACAFLDRSVISVLMPQLKHQLHLGDMSLGFLSGFAFTICYVLVGLPLAAMAERTSRRNIVAAAIAVWSVMTALCGRVANFSQLVLLRVGVGIGEAGLTPSAHSLISDLFPARRRGTAISVFTVGIHLGVFAGLALGGYLAEHFGWRETFYIISIPGIAIALLILLTIAEPLRGQHEGTASAHLQYHSLFKVVKLLWTDRGLRYTMLGTTFCSFVTFGQGAWLPSFLVRSHGMTIGRAGLLLGIAGGLGGLIGTLIGGFLSDRFGDRNPRWRLWVVAVALAIFPISALVFLYTPSIGFMWATALTGVMLTAVHKAPTSAVTLNLTPPRMRARATAINLFLTNLLGGGLGPLVVGGLSDALKPAYGNDSLRYGLVAVSLFSLGAALSYFVAGSALGAAERPATTEKYSSVT
ncbi:MAG TPA: MFS transporter [Rhizomicrobium sp.]|nr:MFS transporter [Rhizomicrobium sp.]